MSRRRPLPDLPLDGVVTRARLLAAGSSVAQIRAQVAAGRWQVLEHGVYALSGGPITPRTRLQGALLRAGTGACAGPWASPWLVGALDDPPRVLDVLVPDERRMRCSTFRVARRTGLAELVHPAAEPARLRLEAAVLDACDQVDRPERVVDLVIRVVQRRLTTPERLRAALGDRARHRWRGLLADLLADVKAGVRSALERVWPRRVIRPHGLPVGSLNHAERDGSRTVHRDVRYEKWVSWSNSTAGSPTRSKRLSATGDATTGSP